MAEGGALQMVGVAPEDFGEAVRPQARIDRALEDIIPRLKLFIE